jgi:uncharacterized protein YbjT (DUF2867 family)
MHGKTILIAGPTGLIGRTTLTMALADDRFQRVIALTRRPVGIDRPKLEEWRHEDLPQALHPATVDAALCCLGTTIAKVGGDRARFLHVDKDLVLSLGRWAKEQGVSLFSVVSAVGADAGSRIFYNRVKGEMEDGLRGLGLPTLHIMQPSILTGPRREKRPGERIGIALMSAIGPLLPMKYKPMPHDVLARALLNSVFDPSGGVHTGAAIHRLAAQNSTTRT